MICTDEEWKIINENCTGECKICCFGGFKDKNGDYNCPLVQHLVEVGYYEKKWKNEKSE